MDGRDCVGLSKDGGDCVGGSMDGRDCVGYSRGGGGSTSGSDCSTLQGRWTLSRRLNGW